MIELALPAGSLQAALQAFKEGADAVYLGMRKFSARKGATNFSFDDLAALRKIADEQDRKIYVTVNTIIEDEELPQIIAMLRQIAFIGTEGLIVQDLGVARIVRDLFPSIPLHGSTQLAVHTIEGVKAMQDLGFSRVVLSRELTLEEIRTTRTACPDVELKVFVHGALCYGFSGLCMASRMLCDRSANCGACAQICRTWFTLEPAPVSATTPVPADKANRQGWFFSMTDLDIGNTLLELDKMGIDSAKIEGRMKSPAYVAAATRYYRAILDRKPQDEIDILHDELHTIFSRSSDKGWMDAYGRDSHDCSDRRTRSLGTVSYPGHIGTPVATVSAVLHSTTRTYIQVRLKKDIAIRDGLMFLLPGNTAPMEPRKFSLNAMFDKRGTMLTHARQGEQVAISVTGDIADAAMDLQSGDLLYQISAHDQNIGLLHDENLPRRKRAIDMEVTINPDGLTLSTSWNVDYLPKLKLNRSYELEINKAQRAQDLEGNLKKMFLASDTSLCTLNSLSLANNTQLKESDIFIPLSILKDIKRDWYGRLDDILYTWFEGKDISTDTLQVHHKESETRLPLRQAICSPTKDRLPWIDIEALAEAFQASKVDELTSSLPQVNGLYYIPLHPVMFDEERYLKSLNSLVDEFQQRNMLDDVLFGLNNVAHIRWAKKHPFVRVFCDIYLYLGNGQAANMLLDQLPSLEGGYFWLERHSLPPLCGWPFVPTAVEAYFLPPLFISRSCFRHDTLGLSCEGCPRKGNWVVSQHGNEYQVRVNRCITTVNKIS